MSTASELQRRAATPLFRSIPGADPAGPALGRLRALVLLGATLRATPFTAAIARPILDLPIDQGRTLLEHWCEQAAALAAAVGLPRLAVRVLRDGDTPEPRAPRACDAAAAVDVRLELDPVEYRGTGGVLRDVAAGYDDSDRILVASAGQLLSEPLSALAVQLSAAGGDVALIAHEDGTPSSVMLARCGCLWLIPAIGFVDMKEQALPQIARDHAVRVCKRARPVGWPVRGLADYIEALRRHHAARRSGGPFAEDWQSSFSVIEDGAEVARDARVHDSVVLRGGRVDGGAVVVRSVVASGGVVRRGQAVVDRLVAPGARA